jgi:hypothetical protein
METEIRGKYKNGVKLISVGVMVILCGYEEFNTMCKNISVGD